MLRPQNWRTHALPPTGDLAQDGGTFPKLFISVPPAAPEGQMPAACLLPKAPTLPRHQVSQPGIHAQRRWTNGAGHLARPSLPGDISQPPTDGVCQSRVAGAGGKGRWRRPQPRVTEILMEVRAGSRATDEGRRFRGRPPGIARDAVQVLWDTHPSAGSCEPTLSCVPSPQPPGLALALWHWGLGLSALRPPHLGGQVYAI
jgi:hypothetical protein